MIWLWLALSLDAAEPAGPRTCSPCHGSHVDRARTSRHANALKPILESSLPPLLTSRPIRDSAGTEFRYQTGGRGVAATVTAPASPPLTGMLEWAFGAGGQAVTPVAFRDGRVWEHRVTYYAAAGRLALTPGHAPRAAGEEAFGVVQSPRDAFRCFHCHATNVRGGESGPDLRAMEPGVLCARCHGPGDGHIREGSRHAISNPGRLPAGQIVEFCGGCHRFPDASGHSDAPELEDPLSVRFQPVGFKASRCFQNSKAFSCVTCHDPHENARHDDGYYASRCASCHSAAPAGKCAREANPNCLPCHMARSTPIPFLTFTDHRIRVVKTD